MEAVCRTAGLRRVAPSARLSARNAAYAGRALPCSRRVAVLPGTAAHGVTASDKKKDAVKEGKPTKEGAAFTKFTNPNAKRRTDLKKIMVLGAGPIVIGQACEFDYSGTQACKALKAEGYEVVLINSNPATIMTDPETAPRTYVGPMTPQYVAEIIEKERPDAVLPTMGGQTALNLAVTLAETGVLKKFGVELIGAKLDAIRKAEDRQLFKDAMERIGVACAPSGCAETMEQALEIAAKIGNYPLIIRPAFTLGGTGGGIAYNEDEFREIIRAGLSASATGQVLVEKSLIGWKEYELEVMRDLADNVVIVCSIENVDPMGVHTGDSITVAPSQTLTDKEYQRLRDAAVACIREIGVECGGSNVQFSINPANGDMIAIEMNPRVSRSSALASKATGFPIAKMAAKLAMGYTLDLIPNDITQKTPASFEPSIDYVITKVPRFAFEKFPGSEPILTTQMKSVGEAMGFGRTFQESFQKTLRAMELGYDGFDSFKTDLNMEQLRYNLRVPNPDRMYCIHQAMMKGMTKAEVLELTNMDPWFVDQFEELVKIEKWVRTLSLNEITAEEMLELKRKGFSDKQLAACTLTTDMQVRERRAVLGVKPSFKRVDTCAAEFEANTPYLYSCYDGNCEATPTKRKKVLILGGGPNRIGQGIEFDYCCCHASFALQAAGFETIMMNCNPETVSTDYDTSDRLYFEPVTLEDVLNVVELERPDGIIVQFGGQTPLKLAKKLDEYLAVKKLATASGDGVVKIWGTSADAIDMAEDRKRFNAVLNKLGIVQPLGATAFSLEDALGTAKKLGYPVMVRPSYVLGGRAMMTCYDEEEMSKFTKLAIAVDPTQPVLVDKYIDNAIECDVDALCDATGMVVIGGIMEHIELAGVHSGDSACSIPPNTLSKPTLDVIRKWTAALARELGVVGLLNIQYAIQKKEDHGTPEDVVFILEANPRASRTVPFVSKAVGHPLAKYASRIMSGETLKSIGLTEEPVMEHVAVKEAVLPFEKFAGADTLLGPEMRSTGEVMGIDKKFAPAYAKAAIAAGMRIPLKGKVFISMADRTKTSIVPIAKGLSDEGFTILATAGTAKLLADGGVPVTRVLKIHEGRPHCSDLLRNGDIQMMIMTSSGTDEDKRDGLQLRRMALALKVPLITTVAAARATYEAIKYMKTEHLEMVPLQDYLPAYAKASAEMKATRVVPV